MYKEYGNDFVLIVFAGTNQDWCSLPVREVGKVQPGEYKYFHTSCTLEFYIVYIAREQKEVSKMGSFAILEHWGTVLQLTGVLLCCSF